MKKILGLDLGTNSIGWAVVKSTDSGLTGIECAGSRIIPMDAALLSDFDKGNSISQTAERTRCRGVRRLVERNILRRERLHRVLDIMGFLPKHYSEKLDRYGKFVLDSEPKIAWRVTDDGKFEFVFKNAFDEMISDFKRVKPELFCRKANGTETKLPYDWSIYYLRKKALSHKISKEELAWILLNFNHKRGYYQLRGEEEEENPNKLVEFHSLKVVSVEDSGDRKGKDIWYNVNLENGWVYRRSSSIELDWVGTVKDFIVTTELDANGEPKLDKEKNAKRSFRAPKDDDWTLVKKKTEHDVEQSHKTVGEYIYGALLDNPAQKIRGRLIRTIERKYYKDELKRILEVQKTFHPELQDRQLYLDCVGELYPHNKSHRESIGGKDMTHLFVEDIIFYQRPLKSKKSLISDCPYESRFDKHGKEYPVKCIAKSHPLFQEFRLWQFVSNLKIYEREKEVNGRLMTDVDVTLEFIKSEDDCVALFEWLNDRKEIEQKILFEKYFKIKKPKGKEYGYRWNYVEDKVYPCNTTRAEMLAKLDKTGISSDFLTKEKEEGLWHILYSVDDKNEIVKALNSFASKYQLNNDFVEQFRKFHPFKKEYGSYSAKAIKKLLSLMRMGKYWNAESIDNHTITRIDKIITGEFDDNIRLRVREKSINLTDKQAFKALPLWLACYIVYDRHSEVKDVEKWEKPEDIDAFLREFKQHYLRNPIVEQIVTETLRTVRDIWREVGHIDEIHIELGREMKNPADVRAKMTRQINDNENTNLRVKAMLAEFINNDYNIAGVRPYSPGQQDILRIYEEYAISNLKENDSEYEFVSKMAKTAQPSKSDILRYKLWLEQKYRSPYTGETISLGRLFTSDYEIEHIIPQSRYFDDSFSNKVICEAEVNKLKDNSLGYEFIKNNQGRIVPLSYGKQAQIFNLEVYEDFVKEHYSGNRGKMKKLLLEDIPDGFIERQLNDSRYISKYIKGLLSNMVRVNGELEATSKNVISCNGGITDRLKKDWGVNNVWNSIILPRFERLNELTGTTHFTAKNQEGHSIPNMPLELQKGFNKKRIDHRHHAMDAIVIACATRDHVNLLNNEAAKSKNNANRYHLSKKLQRYEPVTIVRNGESKVIDAAKEFYKPWATFDSDVKVVLENIVVSFKQNLRVINKTTNYYQHYESGKKALIKQEQGDSWAIRKPMHKDTVFGEVNLKKVKSVSFNEAMKSPIQIVNKDFKKKALTLLNEGLGVNKIKKYFEENKDVWSDVSLSKVAIYYFTKSTNDRYFATRKVLDTTYDAKKITDSVTDTGIQKILLRHLAMKGNSSELAFSPEGVEEMNRNILQLNEGKRHKPIYTVRWYEKADKFAVGKRGNKSTKFVEAAKGTKLFFAVYESGVLDEESGEIKKKRDYASIPLNVAIERQKQGLPTAPDDDNGNQPIFVLSPQDLVYIPTSQEIAEGLDENRIDKSRIYKVVSFNGKQLYVIPYFVANVIIDKKEFGQLNKFECIGENKRTLIKVFVSRTGKIKLDI